MLSTSEAAHRRLGLSARGSKRCPLMHQPGCRLGRNGSHSPAAPPFLGRNLGIRRRKSKNGIRLADAAGVELGRKRLASREPFVEQVRKRVKRLEETSLHVVEAPRAVAVFLRSGSIARIEVVAILLLGIHLPPQLRDLVLLLILLHRRAGSEARNSRQRRQ
jgi:hypothetical protein